MKTAEKSRQSNMNSSREMSETEVYLSLVSDLDAEVSDEDTSEDSEQDFPTEDSEQDFPTEDSEQDLPAADIEQDLPAADTEQDSSTAESNQNFPTADQLERELEHEQYRNKYLRTLRGTVFTLITVSAVAVLIAMLFLPVLQIYGTSMTPTLYAGDTVISVKTSDFETGDVIAFYLTSNRVLVKRVIATAGQWVDIDEDGNVYVDGELLDEPYVDELAYGECDIELPYQVPDGQYFVMGDHRSTSVDSRSTSVGCVTDDQVVGKVVFRVWPFSSFGFIS